MAVGIQYPCFHLRIDLSHQSIRIGHTNHPRPVDTSCEVGTSDKTELGKRTLEGNSHFDHSLSVSTSSLLLVQNRSVCLISQCIQNPHITLISFLGDFAFTDSGFDRTAWLVCVGTIGEFAAAEKPFHLREKPG